MSDINFLSENRFNPTHFCCICGAGLTDGKCLSCTHEQCEGCRKVEAMLKMAMFGIGERDGKYHAFCDAEDFDRLEGPARDTQEEAIADRDQARSILEAKLKEFMPNAIISQARPS